MEHKILSRISIAKLLPAISTFHVHLGKILDPDRSTLFSMGAGNLLHPRVECLTSRPSNSMGTTSSDRGITAITFSQVEATRVSLLLISSSTWSNRVSGNKGTIFKLLLSSNSSLLCVPETTRDSPLSSSVLALIVPMAMS